MRRELQRACRVHPLPPLARCHGRRRFVGFPAAQHQQHGATARAARSAWLIPDVAPLRIVSAGTPSSKERRPRRCPTHAVQPSDQSSQFSAAQSIQAQRVSSGLSGPRDGNGGASCHTRRGSQSQLGAVKAQWVGRCGCRVDEAPPATAAACALQCSSDLCPRARTASAVSVVAPSRCPCYVRLPHHHSHASSATLSCARRSVWVRAARSSVCGALVLTCGWTQTRYRLLTVSKSACLIM